METKSKLYTGSADENDSGLGEDIRGVEIKTEYTEEEQLSSEELQDIISYKPVWIVRKGTAIIGVVLLILLGIASFIHYPDYISATMKIVSTHRPVKVSALRDGRLERVLVANGSIVKKNQALAFVQSNAKPTEASKANRHIIISPEDGIVHYEMPLQQNQYIDASQNLFSIEPSNNSFYGELIIRQSESGKIKEGQTVIIKLEKYPSREYGHLLGKVSFVSPVLLNNGCAVYVALPEDRRSSYNKTVFYKNNLTAGAEIITGDHKLLEKVIAFGNPLSEK